MNKKIAVCIDVDKVKDFTKLNGASLGAVRFSEWASKIRYTNETILKFCILNNYKPYKSLL